MLAQIGPLRAFPGPFVDGGGRHLFLHPQDWRGAGADTRHRLDPAYGGMDHPADPALPEFAARPDRGAGLRPRMATRLRQAAAAALVDGRGRLPAGWSELRVLPA